MASTQHLSGRQREHMISIEPARSDLDLVRELFMEYAAEISDRVCFTDFRTELDHLGEWYDVARGCLLLAKLNGAAVGCVGVRHIDRQTCEMKRLYVRSEARSRGLGRMLASAALRAAEEIGYRSMHLETLSSMQAAQALYRSLGFTLRHSSEPTGPDVIRMARTLQKASKAGAATSAR